MDTDLKDLVNKIFTDTGIEKARKSESTDAFLKLVNKFQPADARLPDKPEREYLPREENIIDYLRSPVGFGPWLERGLLTRPLIGEKSVKAYTALNNWLRNNQLPDDLKIPTKSEVVMNAVQDLADNDDVVGQIRASLRNARRLERMVKRSI